MRESRRHEACLPLMVAAFLALPLWLSPGADGVSSRAQPALNSALYSTRGALQQSEPILQSKEIRFPFIYFRQALNHKWQPRYFLPFLVFAALSFSFVAPGSLKAAVDNCRNNLPGCLAYSIIFTVLTMILAKAAFAAPALEPLGVVVMGLVELAYLLGLAVGTHSLAESLTEKCRALFAGKKAEASSEQEPAANTGEGRKACLIKIGVVILVAAILSTLTLIPDLGRLPRLGNRLLVVLAMLGLGGLLKAKYRQN